MSAEASGLRAELVKANKANAALRLQLDGDKAVAEAEIRALEIRAEAERLRQSDLAGQLRQAIASTSAATQALETRVKAAQDLVQSLDSKIKLLTESGDVVERERKDSLDQEVDSAKTERERVNVDIATQQQAVNDAQAQLKYWRSQKGEVARAKVEALERALPGQQQALASLKAKKVSIDENERENKRVTASSAQSQKEDIAVEKKDLGEKLKSAKAELADGSKKLAEAQRRDGDVSQRKQRLQAAIEASRDALNAIEADIAKKRAKIAQIK
jgi:chromosome segregation ATPase